MLILVITNFEMLLYVNTFVCIIITYSKWNSNQLKGEEMDLDKETLLGNITEIRRHLHMYPEKAFSEFETAKYITGRLKRIGIDVVADVAGTGVIGIIKGQPGFRSIAVRADMDCLEVNEDTGISFASKIPGRMHACGHDGHMAAVLGLAEYLACSGKIFKDNILFIFQPAEEGPGGAKTIVESGILDDFKIKAFLALHIFPEIEQGKIGCCAGPMTARNGEVDIKVSGKSSHGALPHEGIDSIVVSAQLIQAIQSIISRRLDPRDSAVITFGKIYGGEARNIIPGGVALEGTIRAFSEDVYNTIKKNIFDLCNGIGTANGCSIEAEIRDMYPEVYNDSSLFDTLLRTAGKDNVEVIKPLMISEDFSYYKNVAPELMFMLGSRNEYKGYTYPLHNSKFNFDEDILMLGISVFIKMIQVLEK